MESASLSSKAGKTMEQRNRFAEFKALLYFALSYSLLAHKLWRDGNVLYAYKRFLNIRKQST
jgi:hypothetical protein